MVGATWILYEAKRLTDATQMKRREAESIIINDFTLINHRVDQAVAIHQGWI